MTMVTCPCCKGEKRLTVIEHDEEEGRTILTKPECCKGKVLAEVEETTSESFGQFGQFEQLGQVAKPILQRLFAFFRG